MEGRLQRIVEPGVLIVDELEGDSGDEEEKDELVRFLLQALVRAQEEDYDASAVEESPERARQEPVGQDAANSAQTPHNSTTKVNHLQRLNEPAEQQADTGNDD